MAELGEYDAAVPVDGEFYHPLAACYRTQAAATIEQLLDRGELRTSDLFQKLLTNRIHIRDLRGVDPELLTLMNVNTPADYAKAVELAELTIDSAVNKQLGL